MLYCLKREDFAVLTLEAVKTSLNQSRKVSFPGAPLNVKGGTVQRGMDCASPGSPYGL